MICEMQISVDGEISRYHFSEAIMHSHARMTYSQVAQIISQREEGNKSGIRKQFAAIVPHVDDPVSYTHLTLPTTPYV